MRDLYRSLALLETRLSETYGLSLNEAMVLCSIGEETVMAGVVVERTGLTASHASKMIRSVEEKGLLVRTLGEKDKRQMYFALTDKAKEKLEDIRKHGIENPHGRLGPWGFSDVRILFRTTILQWHIHRIPARHRGCRPDRKVWLRLV